LAAHLLQSYQGAIVTPVEMIRDASSKTLTTKSGKRISLELRSPLSVAEIAAFEERLPCPLPADVRDLLAYCRGFEGGGVDFVDFTGLDCDCEYESFPHGLPFAADGCGNFWIIDLWPDSKSWGPIYFACHDPAVILYQSPSLEHLLAELFKKNLPPYESQIDDVHEDRLFQVWSKNPGVMSQEECLGSPDPELCRFAETLSPAFQIIDMRNAPVGFGFSWGRYGPGTVLRRQGAHPIFAYERPQGRKGPFARLFGRSG
jgi:hypothetical protein